MYEIDVYFDDGHTLVLGPYQGQYSVKGGLILGGGIAAYRIRRV